MSDFLLHVRRGRRLGAKLSIHIFVPCQSLLASFKRFNRKYFFVPRPFPLNVFSSFHRRPALIAPVHRYLCFSRAPGALKPSRVLLDQRNAITTRARSPPSPFPFYDHDRPHSPPFLQVDSRAVVSLVPAHPLHLQVDCCAVSADEPTSPTPFHLACLIHAQFQTPHSPSQSAVAQSLPSVPYIPSRSCVTSSLTIALHVPHSRPPSLVPPSLPSVLPSTPAPTPLRFPSVGYFTVCF